MLSSADEGVDDILGMLCNDDEGVNDTLGMLILGILPTAERVWVTY